MKKIAVVGTGISGLASAWILSQKYAVTVYEKNDYVGGHANTRPAKFGDTTVYADTGFMVFNHKTYPNILKMFGYLGVSYVKTDMAFGISVGRGTFEFSSDNVFVQKSNICQPWYWKMLWDIVYFNRRARMVGERHPDEYALGELLDELSVGKAFRMNYILPMASAIWSTDKNSILAYPAKQFIAFFDNHGLLSPKTLNPFQMDEGRLQWYTVSGGSRVYVKKILERMKADIRLSCGVVSVLREHDGVFVEDERGERTQYDHVVLASHPDQTLRVLADARDDERSILGAFKYTPNETYMHRDSSYMMTRTSAWPSWTYSEPNTGASELTYYMNRLQAIPKETPVFVTLNPHQKPKEETVFYHTTYAHPRFSVDTYSAQKRLKTIQGTRNTWYVGAWCGHGFHEDGLQSALDVTQHMNVSVPWGK